MSFRIGALVNHYNMFFKRILVADVAFESLNSVKRTSSQSYCGSRATTARATLVFVRSPPIRQDTPDGSYYILC